MFSARKETHSALMMTLLCGNRRISDNIQPNHMGAFTCCH